MSEREPYIGVTGVKTDYEALSLVKSFKEADIKSIGYIGMIGILSSSKRLLSDSHLEDVASIALASQSSDTVSIVHYYTPDPGNLEKEMNELIVGVRRIDESALDGVQINIPWPEPKVLCRLKKAYNLQFVLQMGPRVLIDNASEKTLLKQIQTYRGIVEYILIDPSGGHGKNLDFTTAEKFSSLIEEAFEGCSNLPVVIFSGGLSDENVSANIACLQKFARCCFGVDAQKKLMGINGYLDLSKTRRYIFNASETLG